MEEKRKIKINKKVVAFSLLALLLLMIGSTSYAYFTAVIEGNDTAKQVTVKTGTMSLALHGTTIVSPTNSLMPGESHTINFSVENTGTIATTYALKMDITNDFKDKKDLVYTLKKGDTTIKNETPLPSPISGTTVLLPIVEIASGTTDNYTMTITFKETGDDQNDNQGRTFTGRVQISEATNKMLAVNLINNSNVKTTTPNFSTYPNEENTGLFQAEDDEGTSYYYRGNIDNNYVDIGTTYSKDVGVYAVGVNGTKGTFLANTYETAVEDCTRYYEDNGYASAEACITDIQDYSAHVGDKILWRVVRINGDGTIRLISGNIVGYMDFNRTDGHKYVGYTYDNSAPNVQDGTASTIKSYLDNWYTTNITNKGLDNLIQTSTYCNDTSISRISGGANIYGANGRIYAMNPQLTCNDTEQTYGGKYVLKVGLPSIDEIMMAGYAGSIRASETTYIWYPDWFWTGSPSDSSETDAFVVNAYSDGTLNCNDNTDNAGGVRPVINLKADTIITSGDGTKDNPYIVR